MQNPNQFSQSVTKGQMDLKYSGSVMSCIVGAGLALVPGQKVKLLDVTGKGLFISPITADSDDVFGVVPYDTKQASYSELEAVEIAGSGSVLYLEASAAIARGASVMPVLAGEKIATATVGKSIVGIMLDKATADTELVRVLLADPTAKLKQA